MILLDMLKVFFLGIVEGITEWLPISSTGHMLLLDELLNFRYGAHPAEYREMFIDVIQLGAILAVVLVFWHDMWPFRRTKDNRVVLHRSTISMWLKAAVACIPGAVFTFAFNDYIEAHLSTPYVIAGTLIFYGIVFILIENYNKKRTPCVQDVHDITFKQAFIIGLFQVLSLIPGTSRSGSTIIGALVIGISRKAAAEFTFFLAVPVMVGMSAYKLLGYGLEFGIVPGEILLLLFGMLIAFAVSLFVVRFLMSYIRRHDFKVFGWYRIALGIVVIVYSLIAARG